MSVSPPGAPQSTAVGSPPGDADDTRSKHFGALLRHPVTLIGGLALVVGAFILVALAASPSVGLASAAGAGLLVVLVVWLVASSRAEADFFNFYARGHGLILGDGRGALPPVTPLLRKGDKRYTDRELQGALPGGVEGALALYTYEDSYRDSDGDRHTTYYRFTLVYSELPECAGLIREMYCQRRVGFQFLDSAEDAFRRSHRVEVESAAADQRYEIFVDDSDDDNVARQILSPSFVVWLSEHAPESFAFELVAGVLVCNVKGHLKSAVELDDLCEAASAVVRRLREEAAE